MRSLAIGLLAGVSAGVIASAAGAAKAQESGALDEIVVTAERLETTAQRSAISVTAVSGADLTQAGVTQVTDLTKKVPGLEIASAGTLTQIYVRGVGANIASSYSETAVAFNLDQTYISRSTAIGGNFYDLERVEVVKGPQGTLYGRNATGGAVNVITRKPALGQFGGEVIGEYGNYNAVKLNGAMNVPLGETVAARFALQRVNRDGYYSDGYDDDESFSSRGHLFYKPNEKFSVLLSADYYEQKGQGQSWTVAQLANDRIGPSDPRAQAIFRNAAIARYGAALGGQIPVPQADGFVDNYTYDFRGEIKWALGFADLTVIPDFRRSKADSKFYPNGVDGLNKDDAEQKSLEARLSNSNDKLNWVLGSFFFREDQDTFYAYAQGLFNQEVYGSLSNENYAFFGQATYHLTDTFRATGGLRYTHETKTQKGTVYCSSLFCPLPGVRVPFDGDRSWENVSGKVGVEYDVAPRSMVYANVSTGFKAGGFGPIIAPNTFSPEKLTAYSIGAKNRFLDNRLQLNAELFWWDYKGQQVSFLSQGQIAPGVVGNVFVTENIGKSSIKGADVDAEYKLTRDDTFLVRVSYLDATADEFVYHPASAPFSNCAISGAAPRVTVDCSGRPLPRSPKWSATLSYEHVFDLGDNGLVTASIASRMASKSWGSITYLADHMQKGYTKTDAFLSYSPLGQKWTATAYINNIENEAVQVMAGTYSLMLVNYKNLQAPRTYGVRMALKFGG